MELLVLAPYPPYPPRFGGATRVYHLLRTLARAHRVTLLCFASPAEAEELGALREFCAAVHTVDYTPAARRKRLYQLRSLVGRAYSAYLNHSPRMAAALDRLLRRQRFDLVQLEFGDMAGYYTLPAGVLQVLDEHNVEHLLFERTWRLERSALRRFYYGVQARKLKADELSACRRADAILTTSDVDCRALAPYVDGTPIRVVPNGVDTGYFAPDGTPEVSTRVVFTGSIAYQPNTDGVLYFADEIWGRVRAAVPAATLAVVGKDPPERIRALAGDGIDVTGTVPDVRPWLRSAAVAVVPLRVGGGTRLKILEALATGRAVVSTSLGCEGLEVTDGADILIADSPAAFAEAVVRCLRDPALRARLGTGGRALVERRYRWEAIGEDLGAFYAELADRRRRAAAARR